MTFDDIPKDAGQQQKTGSGLLRLSQILAPNGPIPVGRSTWYSGIRSGRFPAPVRIGKRIVAWRASDIAALIEKGAPDA